MSVGALHKVVVFKQNTPVQKGAGYEDSYSTLLTTRGELKALSGSRSFTFGEVLNSASYELTVRYQQDLEDNLRADMKVEIDSRTFTVVNWEKQGEKRFYYKILLNEQRN